MKEIKKLLIINAWVTIILLFLIVCLPTYATSLDIIESNYTDTVPIIDGVFHEEEWGKAEHSYFVLSPINESVSKSMSCEYYIMNDEKNLYICVLLFDQPYIADEYYRDEFWIRLSNNTVLPVLDPIIEIDGFNPYDAKLLMTSPLELAGVKEDVQYVVYYPYSERSWLGGDLDSVVNGTITFEASLTHSNPTQNATGDYTFEFSIPLTGERHNNTPIDLFAEPGKTVGVQFIFVHNATGKLRENISIYSFNLTLASSIPLPKDYYYIILILVAGGGIAIVAFIWLRYRKKK